MHPVFTQSMGILGVGLGCYLLLALAIPRFKAKSISKDPATLLAVGAAFSILLCLWGLGVARPYTMNAALSVLAIAYIILRRDFRQVIAISKETLTLRAIRMLLLINLIALAIYKLLT